MRIGFYLENRNIEDVDFRKPEKGNPGSGGTEYMFVALPYYLQKYYAGRVQPIIFGNHVRKLPDEIQSYQVLDALDAARKANDISCDLFVFRPYRHPNMEILDLLSDLNLHTIGWAHVTPTSLHQREITKNPFINALVCVEHEQYDLIQDSVLRNRLTYIVNGFDTKGFELEDKPEKKINLVVYIGALVPQKGFHILARAWPKIVRRVPNAELRVIGSGALYNSKVELGQWGIACGDYENEKIIPYLSDSQGNLLPSVKFMGKLGLEKKYLLYQAIVGVANPSGQTENCPGSVLELQAAGTPVVSGAYYGLLDTVVNEVTGLLGRSEDSLVDHVCALLENPKKAIEMGENGKKFVKQKYNFEKVTLDWMNLFDRILNGNRLKYIRFKSNYHRHYKWLIVVNRFFQLSIGRIIYWPSVMEMKEYITRFLRRCK